MVLTFDSQITSQELDVKNHSSNYKIMLRVLYLKSFFKFIFRPFAIIKDMMNNCFD